MTSKKTTNKKQSTDMKKSHGCSKCVKNQTKDCK